VYNAKEANDFAGRFFPLLPAACGDAEMLLPARLDFIRFLSHRHTLLIFNYSLSCKLNPKRISLCAAGINTHRRLNIGKVLTLKVLHI
jgi:hypothetical protein